jgi:hypothetical protein
MTDYRRPYPWWTRIWPLGRIYFAGWQRGEEAGIERGRFQMGAQVWPTDGLRFGNSESHVSGGPS